MRDLCSLFTNIEWIPLVAITTLLLVTRTDGACTNLDSSVDASYDKTVEVNGECFHAFSNTRSYADAETLCGGLGMMLPNFEDETKQIDVYTALGSSYSQHWTGLKYVLGEWQWWDVNTGTGTQLGSGNSHRWEGGTSGECAYSFTGNAFAKFKPAQFTMQYRTVCEGESGGGASSGCRGNIELYNNIRKGFYDNTDTLDNSKLVAIGTRHTRTQCAQDCLVRDTCCSISYNSESKICKQYQHSASDPTVNCVLPETCYQLV